MEEEGGRLESTFLNSKFPLLLVSMDKRKVNLKSQSKTYLELQLRRIID
jgi:hypothetical protein